MTLHIGIYNSEGIVHCSISTHDTGHPADCTELHKRIANQLEAGAYEGIRKLVTNNEIPEAVIIWDGQTIRVKHG